ncbi:hypothetical protein GCG54_00012716 [Colletotrichum gloeosporioides]|uniref:Uncharacterized protein n=1 Tax=Colletotrichum gloeosporioides TaxID=474922 RepID=A0A8H4CQ83_COLGL|nr:uncharacterized protein GCG54_00012716 [Colletotrichum gloeosporioides]KAF3808135.1 hypothetical protein GCG54_00012716 [Colletotrichum gloeosporioides]
MGVPKTSLIPWDPLNADHFQRMVACGSRCEEIPEWRSKTIMNQKINSGPDADVWKTLADDIPQRDDLLAEHTSQYPNESVELTDTASAVLQTSRKPTHRPFIPVGHIALELLPEQNKRSSLSSPTIWVMSLYVSWALQSAGLGRSAMAQIEDLAKFPPFNHDTIALDTVQKDFQLSQNKFGKTPHTPSKGIRTSEEWYTRQGYQAIARVDRGYIWMDPETQGHVPVPLVYMIKKLV